MAPKLLSPILVLGLILCLLQLSSAAVTCKEITITPSKGECAEEYKTKRCISNVNYPTDESITTSSAYTSIKNLLEQGPGGTQDTSLEKRQCAQQLMNSYVASVSLMTGRCLAVPSATDTYQSIGDLKLNGLHKIPHGPPSDCSCKSYTDSIFTGFFGVECTKDEQCGEYLSGSNTFSYVRQCCVGIKKIIDKWCKDYAATQVTTLIAYMQSQPDQDKCYDFNCVEWVTGGADSSAPQYLAASLLTLLTLAYVRHP